MREHDLVSRARSIGGLIRTRLGDLAGKHEVIADNSGAAAR